MKTKKKDALRVGDLVDLPGSARMEPVAGVVVALRRASIVVECGDGSRRRVPLRDVPREVDVHGRVR